MVPVLLGLELFALSVSSEDLVVRRLADDIRVTAPRLHFLTGRSLDRLHDGAIVPFDFQLTIAAGSKNYIVQRSFERFVVSYALWEEKFSVVRLRNLRRSGSNLSANAAESWCLENILAPAAGLPADKDLWARLEIRTADAKDQSPLAAEPAISITTLIEIFSRPPRAREDRWSLESGPFRLADLKP